jgi:hypothetical protein
LKLRTAAANVRCYNKIEEGDMNIRVNKLLAADAIINLILGFLLVLFPTGLATALGLPSLTNYFYTSILGAVIFGIGVALGIEYLKLPAGARGLGIGGAIVINLCGGGTLLFWLLFGNLELSIKGQLTLWIIVLIVLGIGLIELVSGTWKSSGKDDH